MIDTIEEKVGVKVRRDFETEECRQFYDDLVTKHNLDCPPPRSIARLVDKLCGHFIEDEITTKPAFVTEHPQVMSPLAKHHRNKAGLTERFELFLMGRELCNAYTELNDPLRQLECFQRAARAAAEGDEEMQGKIDYDFVTALEHGLPPTSGWGCGIDRLTMFLSDNNNIKEVILFPAMKPIADLPSCAQPASAAPTEKKDSATKAEPKQSASKSEPKKQAKPEAKKDAKPKKEAKKAAESKDNKDEDPEVAKKKKLKAVIKEGGKRGVEIEGAADMGGLQFFCTSVDEPEGDLELLEECMKAMNAKPVPGEEERKGCSGHIGKMIFSCGVDQLAVIAYVPEDKLKDLECKDWMQTVLNLFGGKVLSDTPGLCTGVVKANSDKNIFPLKIREPMILEANNYLRKKNLFPEDNSDDDDEMVFGDDDFPS